MLELLLTFVKIGLFTFGGGYAMIPMITHYCVNEKKWITDDEMMNITVIAESTPGPIAINCATFVGFRQAGWIGAVIATLGIVFPSFLIIYLISIFLNNFLEYEIVVYAFQGIKAAVGILIVDAALQMIKKMKKDMVSCIIMGSTALFMFFVNLFSWNFSSLIVLVLAMLVTLILYKIQSKSGAKGGSVH